MKVITTSELKFDRLIFLQFRSGIEMLLYCVTPNTIRSIVLFASTDFEGFKQWPEQIVHKLCLPLDLRELQAFSLQFMSNTQFIDENSKQILENHWSSRIIWISSNFGRLSRFLFECNSGYLFSKPAQSCRKTLMTAGPIGLQCLFVNFPRFRFISDEPSLCGSTDIGCPESPSTLYHAFVLEPWECYIK
jgi:hypothetical protein